MEKKLLEKKLFNKKVFNKKVFKKKVFKKKVFKKKIFKKKVFKKKRFKKKIFYTHKKKLRRRAMRIRRIVKFGRVKLVRRRKKYSVWIKRKKHKSLRSTHNFFFFFTRRRKFFPGWSRKWVRVQRRNKKKYVDIVSLIINKTKPVFRLRYSFRFKNSVLKRMAFKWRIKHYYRLHNEKKFKNLCNVNKKKKFRVLNLFFFLERQLATVCLRFHFFWRLGKAFYWVAKGVVAVNNSKIFYHNFRIKINDFIKVVGAKVLWLSKIMNPYGVQKFHTQFYWSYNYSELSYYIRSAIILRIPLGIYEIKLHLKRRRKNWIKLNSFLYLANSFY